jgi:hypothetical protein
MAAYYGTHIPAGVAAAAEVLDTEGFLRALGPAHFRFEIQRREFRAEVRK